MQNEIRGYSIIGDSVLFKNLVIRQLIKEYTDKGYLINSTFGKGIFVSNKIKPTKYVVVISTIERPDFHLIDLHNPNHFRVWFERIENKTIKSLPEVITDPDFFYKKEVGLPLSDDKTYLSLLKEFIVNFVTFQPLDETMISFIDSNYYLFSKFVEDLLEGMINLSNYYLTIIHSHKRQLIALANFLIKAESKEEFILYYDLKVSKNESV